MIIKTSVSKQRNSLFNFLNLNGRDYDVIQEQRQQQKASSYFILRSMNGKRNMISQFLIKKVENAASECVLNHSSLKDDNDEYCEIQLVSNPFEITQKIQIKISFVSESLNLLYINQVLDVEDLLKRQLIRQNQIFSNNTQFQAQILETNITLQINEIIYEDNQILNQFFTCTNLSLLDIHIDYTSLFRFKKFYRIPKATYLHEITNYLQTEDIQNSLQKATQWLSYSQKGKQNASDLQFLDCNILSVFLKSNGNQIQEMKASIKKYLLKKQIDLFISRQQFNYSGGDDNVSFKNIQLRYLNLKDIALLTNESSLDNFFNQLLREIQNEDNLNTHSQIMLIIDSCEIFMEQDKYNENINKFKIFSSFISQIKAILLLTEQQKKQFFSLSERITQITF